MIIHRKCESGSSKAQKQNPASLDQYGKRRFDHSEFPVWNLRPIHVEESASGIKTT